jgi:hypothetical protein
MAPMIGVGIWASMLSVPTRCYPALCLLIKWVLYGRVQLFYSNAQLVAASILGFLANVS